MSQIQAVDDDQHIYRHWRKRRDFASSYDEFWTESDGRRLPGGGWELPLRLRARSREELKANRRKAHERRYAMLGQLQPILLAAVQAHAPEVPRIGAQLEPVEFVQTEDMLLQLPPALTPV